MAGNTIINRVITEVDQASVDVPVLIIGITNRVDLIDAALLRPSRFRPIAVNLPDEEARRGIIRIYAVKSGVEVNDESVARLAAQTEGFNGDEICSLFRETALAAYRRSTIPSTIILDEMLEHTRQQHALQHLRPYRESD